MSGFSFELEPVDNDRGYGYRGRVGEFGEVDVFHDVTPLRHESSRQVNLHGTQFPEALFSGGAGGIPSLDGGWLRVDGTVVELELKVSGVRKGSRWLEMKHRDRDYTYGIAKKVVELRRGDRSISIGNGKFVSGIGRMRFGRVQGEVDATDLAIAIIMETVDTSALSTLGALFAAPATFLFRPRRDEGTPC
ncbi:hypothetical protein OG372_21150 [Streptomyces sp. NBC_01020]|uniref:hypothetical protein n=1 Tax=unclassified Streptomyces TaxID=2593676 RepID=UPI00386A8EC1|nr:hypothetical protein OG372_21150 [Streptomyces sp. NBC_01020]WSX68013.1 hypothetical protein OG221_16005 [Streptomyces sp. NBC_00932]